MQKVLASVEIFHNVSYMTIQDTYVTIRFYYVTIRDTYVTIRFYYVTISFYGDNIVQNIGVRRVSVLIHYPVRSSKKKAQRREIFLKLYIFWRTCAEKVIYTLRTQILI